MNEEEKIESVTVDPLTEAFFLDAIYALEKLMEFISND